MLITFLFVPVLSDRKVRWPRRLLPPGESRWVCWRDRQTDRDGQTDGLQSADHYITLFIMYAASILMCTFEQSRFPLAWSSAYQWRFQCKCCWSTLFRLVKPFWAVKCVLHYPHFRHLSFFIISLKYVSVLSIFILAPAS